MRIELVASLINGEFRVQSESQMFKFPLFLITLNDEWTYALKRDDHLSSFTIMINKNNS